jgi:hypothetical protein
MICFYGEELLAPRPTPKLEGHPLSAVGDCLFNIFAATLHTGGSSSIRHLRTRHAVVTGTHLSWLLFIVLPLSDFLLPIAFRAQQTSDVQTRFCRNVLSSSGAQTASSVGDGGSSHMKRPGREADRTGPDRTAVLRLVLRLRMSGAIPPLPFLCFHGVQRATFFLTGS